MLWARGRSLTPLRLCRYVLQKYARGLNQLQVHVPIVEIKNAREMLHHVFLAKKIEVGSAILLRENDILGQITNDLDVELLILVVDFRDAL